MKALLILIISIMFAGTIFGQGNNEKLYQAIVKNDTSLVKELLNLKADPNFVVESGPWMKVNMLITAVNKGAIDIVKILIGDSVDVKWKDGSQTTALMYAASKGNKDIVILLLNNGADINNNDGQGNNVLTASKESGNKDLIKYIKNKLTENQQKK